MNQDYACYKIVAITPLINLCEQKQLLMLGHCKITTGMGGEIT